MLQSSETDENRDGKLDALHLTLQMPIKPHERVYEANIFLLFDVKLHVRMICALRTLRHSWSQYWSFVSQRLSTVHLEGLALVQASSSGLSGAGFSQVSDLMVVQKQPIAHRVRTERSSDDHFYFSLSLQGRDTRFSQAIFDQASIHADAYNLARVLEQYQKRNCEHGLS